MSSRQATADLCRTLILLLPLAAAGCASSNSLHLAHQAEQAQDYDRAVVEYTKVGARRSRQRRRPAVTRADRRCARRRNTPIRGAAACRPGALRRSASSNTRSRPSSTRPTCASTRRCATRGRNCAPRSAVTRGGKTELESLIERTRDTPAPGLELPDDVKLPGSLVFGNGASGARGLPRRRPLREPERDLRSGVPRSAAQHRPAQRLAARRDDVADREHAHLLPGHGAAHGDHRPRHAGQASRIRRVGRSGRST